MSIKNRKKPPFRGVGTALITPFCDGEIDLTAFRRLVERQITLGADALVVCGTTGEAVTLGNREKAALLATACEAANGCIPVVAGTGSADTRVAVATAKYAEDHGADALLVVTPYYNKGTREGVIKHYLTIADAVDLPIILYNVPSRTGVDLTLPTIARLCEHENIVAVKEASGDIDRAADVYATIGEKCAVYGGNDGEFLPTLSVGGIGIISVLSNLLPREMSDLYQLYREGKCAEATALHARLLPLTRLLFADTNPAPVKAAMASLGLCRDEVRLPLTVPEPALYERLRAEIAKWK
ncbi:MAG: 4-hydroxy-tetrahydrodipicolinate synthase [Clostridia bacterium]|nr:4-hydroxy-tetrahydrodipicolinate synthase [Clostridia bacterium]